MSHTRTSAILAWMFFGVMAASSNTLPPTSVLNQIVLCGSGIPPCQTLAQSSGAPVSVTNDTQMQGASQVTVTGTVSENLTTGVLSAFSSYSNLSGPFFTQMNSDVQIFDIVTISSAPLNGTLGSFSPSYTLSGVVTASGLGAVTFGFEDSVGTAPFVSTAQFIAGSGVLTFAPVSFHFGQPFLLFTAFGASVFMGVGGPLSGSADYSHTAMLSGLSVFDGSGSRITGVTINSELGIPVAALSPEPGTYLLAVGALALITAVRRRRVGPPGDRRCNLKMLPMIHSRIPVRWDRVSRSEPVGSRNSEHVEAMGFHGRSR